MKKTAPVQSEEQKIIRMAISTYRRVHRAAKDISASMNPNGDIEGKPHRGMTKKQMDELLANPTSLLGLCTRTGHPKS